MSGENEREKRRASYRQVLRASPLPMDAKLTLTADAHYMVDRLRGEAATPPPHWPPEQVTAFEEILEDPEARTALWAELAEGQRRLDEAAAALGEDDGPLGSSRN